MWGKFASRRGEARYPGLWDGRVAAWCPSVTGPTGTRLYDLQSQRYQGTLTNMDTPTDWVLSSGQYALDFDGVNDYVNCGTSTGLKPTGFTYSAWIRPNAQNFAYNQIMGWDAGGSTSAVCTLLLKSNLKLAIYIAGGPFGTYDGNGVFTLSSGLWYHVAATLTPAAAVGYVNGVVDRSVAGGIASVSTGLFWIGSQNGYTTRYYSGQMDDIAVYNRALTAGEIRTLSRRRGIAYEARRQDFGEAGFKAYWSQQRTQLIGGGLR